MLSNILLSSQLSEKDYYKIGTDFAISPHIDVLDETGVNAPVAGATPVNPPVNLSRTMVVPEVWDDIIRWWKYDASTSSWSVVVETASASGGGGVDNSGQSLGGGQAIYAGDAGSNLTFKSLVAGSGVALSADASEITVSLDINNLVADTLDNSDAIAFYDVSGAEQNKITVGNLNAFLSHDALSGFDANEHVDHSTVTVTGTGALTGGGDITASRVLSLDITGQAADAGELADEILIWDTSASGFKKMSLTQVQALIDTDTNTQRTDEEIEDVVGGMLSGTQTGITVSYDDPSGNLNFVTTVQGVSDLANGLDVTLNSGNVRVAYDFTELANIASVDAANDRIIIYDQNAGTHGYITPNQLGIGEANTASNLGAGEGIFGSKSGVDLRFKSITVSDGLAVSSGATEIDLALDINGQVADAGALADEILFWDVSVGGMKKMTFTQLQTLIDTDTDTVRGVADQANGLDISLNGNNIEVDYDFTELSLVASPDGATDRLILYDVSGSTHGYVTPEQLTHIHTSPDDSICVDTTTSPGDIRLELNLEMVSTTHTPYSGNVTIGSGDSWFVVPSQLNGWYLVEVRVASSGGTGDLDLEYLYNGVGGLTRQFTCSPGSTSLIQPNTEQVSTGDQLALSVSDLGGGTPIGLTATWVFRNCTTTEAA